MQAAEGGLHGLVCKVCTVVLGYCSVWPVNVFGFVYNIYPAFQFHVSANFKHVNASSHTSKVMCETKNLWKRYDILFENINPPRTSPLPISAKLLVQKVG